MHHLARKTLLIQAVFVLPIITPMLLMASTTCDVCASLTLQCMQVIQAYTAAQGAAAPTVVTKTPVLPAIALPPVAVTTVTPVTVPLVTAAAPVPAAVAPMVQSAAGPDVIPSSVAGKQSTLYPLILRGRPSRQWLRDFSFCCTLAAVPCALVLIAEIAVSTLHCMLTGIVFPACHYSHYRWKAVTICPGEMQELHMLRLTAYVPAHEPQRAVLGVSVGLTSCAPL